MEPAQPLDESRTPMASEYGGFAQYPRPTAPPSLPPLAILLRAFVIGNFWLAFVAIPLFSIAIWMGVSGRFDGDRGSDHSMPIESLIFYIPFVVGFAVASIRPKPKRLSPLFAGLAGIPSGIMWLVLTQRTIGPGWTFLLWIGFIVLMCFTAVGFNRFLQNKQAGASPSPN